MKTTITIECETIQELMTNLARINSDVLEAQTENGQDMSESFNALPIEFMEKSSGIDYNCHIEKSP